MEAKTKKPPGRLGCRGRETLTSASCKSLFFSKPIPRAGYMIAGPSTQWRGGGPAQKLVRLSRQRQESVKPRAEPS